MKLTGGKNKTTKSQGEAKVRTDDRGGEGEGDDDKSIHIC